MRTRPVRKVLLMGAAPAGEVASLDVLGIVVGRRAEPVSRDAESSERSARRPHAPLRRLRVAANRRPDCRSLCSPDAAPLYWEGRTSGDAAPSPGAITQPRRHPCPKSGTV